MNIWTRNAPRARAGLRRSLVLVAATCVGLTACSSGPAVDPDLEESIRWYTGIAGRVDNERARELLERAAADDDPISVMWMARVFSTGRMGFPEDPARARDIAAGVVDVVEELANEDVAEACFLMGTAYAEGLGRPVNPVGAVAWYRRAAALGNGLAWHNLGNVYAAGTGVPQSDSLAVVWWRRAADQGDAIPQLRLGTMYEEGRGVAPDLVEARRWYEASAERGNADATAALERLAAGR